MKDSTQEVVDAARKAPPGPIQKVLEAACAQAQDDEDYWEAVGKWYLRTFLQTTPVGIAILELARSINEEEV